ncbi:MAG: hypothetical protein H6865_07010 [Rhodospirillales bacterium]|nr:hypothetical protein [Alphaproteobacteria bacterium]MCB9987366.1 hypothetical protein [Rhodospirillales bacterium]USO07786.1 MAG: hypothetical protein H6866_00695 [Rhodospirillales bacterium]
MKEAIIGRLSVRPDALRAEIRAAFGVEVGITEVEPGKMVAALEAVMVWSPQFQYPLNFAGKDAAEAVARLYYRMTHDLRRGELLRVSGANGMAEWGYDRAAGCFRPHREISAQVCAFSKT